MIWFQKKTTRKQRASRSAFRLGGESLETRDLMTGVAGADAVPTSILDGVEPVQAAVDVAQLGDPITYGKKVNQVLQTAINTGEAAADAAKRVDEVMRMERFIEATFTVIGRDIGDGMIDYSANYGDQKKAAAEFSDALNDLRRHVNLDDDQAKALAEIATSRNLTLGAQLNNEADILIDKGKQLGQQADSLKGLKSGARALSAVGDVLQVGEVALLGVDAFDKDAQIDDDADAARNDAYSAERSRLEKIMRVKDPAVRNRLLKLNADLFQSELDNVNRQQEIDQWSNLVKFAEDSLSTFVPVPQEWLPSNWWND